MEKTFKDKIGLYSAFNANKNLVYMIEVFLYLSMTFRIFGNKIGIFNIEGLSGAIIVAFGLICFFVIVFSPEPIPITIYFALIINAIANVTDLYLYDLFSRNMIYWLSFQLMACFIVRNEHALLRFSFFLATTVFLSVYLGGEFYGREISRLNLADGSAGSMFANSNALAHLAALTATALCFASLKYKIIMKFLCLACAVALSVIVLLTLSRGGLLLLLTGITFYLFAMLLNRGLISSLLILGLLTVTLMSVFSAQFDNISSGYQHRLGQDSDRVSYLLTAKSDMLDTLVSGQGSSAGFSATGLKPHNAFLWLHLALGGFCAWFYFVWVVWLGGSTLKCLLLGNLRSPEKMEMLAFFLMFFTIQFVSIFPPFNFGFVLGLAIIEKHIQKNRAAISTHSEFNESENVQATLQAH